MDTQFVTVVPARPRARSLAILDTRVVPLGAISALVKELAACRLARYPAEHRRNLDGRLGERNEDEKSEKSATTAKHRECRVVSESCGIIEESKGSRRESKEGNRYRLEASYASVGEGSPEGKKERKGKRVEREYAGEKARRGRGLKPVAKERSFSRRD